MYEMDVDLTKDEIEEAFSGILDKTTPNGHHLHNLHFAATTEVETDQYLQDRILPKPRSQP